MSGAHLTAAELSRIAARFRVLAEPARLDILQHLQAGPQHVSALMTATGLRQANLSKHLQLLHAHDMVARVRDGRFIRYAICDPTVGALCDLMCRYVASTPWRAGAPRRRAARPSAATSRQRRLHA